jgi:hypothetical protein
MTGKGILRDCGNVLLEFSRPRLKKLDSDLSLDKDMLLSVI